MINKLKPKSEFSRNVLTLMTGTTIAQAIPIAISPILTRLYTPEDFGIFALFIALSAIFGSIATGRYELAIMLPLKDKTAINIVALGFILTVIISMILLCIVVIFNEYITSLLNNTEIKYWLYLIPVSVFFIGLYNLLSYYNIRKKNYKDIANATIIKSIIIAVVQLSIGFIKEGVSGLISGQVISNMFANIRLLKNIIGDRNLISKVSKIRIIAIAKKYKDFPKFSMWAVLANSFSQHMTHILISILFSTATLGFYSLVQRVLGIPSAFIGSSIGQVFFQEATREKQVTGKICNSFNHTFQKLIIIALPFFGILFFIIEDLFIIVFGKDWQIAGEYAEILVPLFFIKFISSTLSSTLIIYEKQKNELIINMILLFSSVGLIIYFNDFRNFLFVYSIVMVINYLIFLVYYYKLSKGYSWNKK